jgi:hypothetical protein
MTAGSSKQAAPLPAARTQARATQVSANLPAINRRSRPRPAPLHPACPAAYANFALHTMHAHRLWIRLWITLGQSEENSNSPEGNAGVTRWGMPAAHSNPGPSTTASHSRCAHSRPGLAGRIDVIPGIHRSYDDYQFSNDTQIHIKIGKRPAAAPSACAAQRRPGCSGAPATRACDEIPDQIRRATGEDRP